MHREANDPSLVGDRTGDGLTDPPERVGTELVPLRMVKFLDGAQQPEIAFLNEVFQRQAAPLIAFGNAHHQF